MSDYDENDKYNFSSGDEGASDSSILNPLAEALLDRSTILVEEIELFQRSLRKNNLEKKVELRLFLNQVKSEYRSLQGVRPQLLISSHQYCSTSESLVSTRNPRFQEITTWRPL